MKTKKDIELKNTKKGKIESEIESKEKNTGDTSISVIEKTGEGDKTPNPDLEHKKTLKAVVLQAEQNGLMSLNKEDLIMLCKKYGIEISNSKKDMANNIVNKGDNCKTFVLGKPIGFYTPKTSALGFKAYNTYPIDKEREKFFQRIENTLRKKMRIY